MCLWQRLDNAGERLIVSSKLQHSVVAFRSECEFHRVQQGIRSTALSMVFNTLTVANAVTPTVIETYFSHFLNRKNLQHKPTAQITYHEGLELVRQFLKYASQHRVEEVQAFTAQYVLSPYWVRTEDSDISQIAINAAADHIRAQLGPSGIRKVGGGTWWEWRRPNEPLRAEWIEMRKDYNERKAKNETSDRVMLYVHGGAYYFGSVDEHRYQMQRHARRLKARVFAPRYRLAPQFPFPCGLLDCLAAYLCLLQEYNPSKILLAGDSAGGGMVLSLQCILRDRGLPLPAGSILLSPWVDLTHSFPSCAGDASLDYIPEHGFHHKPSTAWPPPNKDEIAATKDGEPRIPATEHQRTYASSGSHRERQSKGPPASGQQHYEEENLTGASKESIDADTHEETSTPSPRDGLSIKLDGKLITIKDQIQLYATNELLSRPLVSPALQPSLGGLPPMLVLTGGGEMLRDEQIYIAHKAANPAQYPPSDAFLDEFDPERETLYKHKGTHVQLQVWEDLCHVAATLSFTKPGKLMYRSVAQFGAWALARAQRGEITIPEDDDTPDVSTSPLRSRQASSEDLKIDEKQDADVFQAKVGRAGDPLPRFREHMIRQRVTTHGFIHPLPPASALPGCTMSTSEIGVIKPGTVRKWLAAQRDWSKKFARHKLSVQRRRVKEMAQGYDVIPGETPPPTALVGRRLRDTPEKIEKRGKNLGLAMWSGWGSKHDEAAIEREEAAERKSSTTATKQATSCDGSAERTVVPTTVDRKAQPSWPRTASRHRSVVDEGQT